MESRLILPRSRHLTRIVHRPASMAALFILLAFGSNCLAQLVRTATGVDGAAILATVDQYRADLGVNNGVGACAGGCLPGIGRREINWDAVPDSFSSGGSSPFPGDFFGQPDGSPVGRIRGVTFSTSGGFEVSADADSDGDGNPGPVPILFGNHAPDNAADFAAFSPERIFGLVGSNELDVTFHRPGQPGVAAGVKGFGAVFTDVEQADSTRIDYYDSVNVLIHSEPAPAFPFTGGDSGKSFSFVGVSFADAVISRVHIVNGSFDLDLQSFGSANDAVAMDDFIYGEPVPVPEPILLSAWLVLLVWSIVTRPRLAVV